MANTSVDVRTDVDGTLVVQPHGAVDADCATLLRQMLVRAVRHVRPIFLVIDLSDSSVDAINLGTLTALCDVADDQHVRVLLDGATAALAVQLRAAGVPAQRVRTRRSATPLRSQADPPPSSSELRSAGEVR
jgi:anti-anti-sigma regulatory factor